MSHLIPKSTRLMPSSWNCFSPKCSNGRGTAPLYALPSRELQLGLGCCLKNRGFFAASVLAKAPRHPPHTNSSGACCTADPGTETGGASSLHNLKNILPASHQKPVHVALKWWEWWDHSPVCAHSNHAEVRKRWLHGQLQVLNSQVTAPAFHNSSPALPEMVI